MSIDAKRFLPALILAVTPAAQAAFLSNFTGWTEMNDCPVCDTTVSFSVWRTEGDSWADDFGVPVTRLDVGADTDYGAPYVYLYQITNTDYNANAQFPPDEPIRDFQVLNRADSPLFTSGGYLHAVFEDANGPVQGLANGNITLAATDFAGDAYDTDGNTTVPQDDNAPDAVPDGPRNRTPASDHLPNQSGVTGISLVADADFVAPIALDLLKYEDFNFNPMNPSAQPDWVPVVDFDWAYSDVDGVVFSPGRYSPVLFLTSWLPPVYDIASTRSADTLGDSFDFPDIPDRDGNLENVFPGANGDLPTAVPAPPVWLLMAAGVFALRRWPGRARCRG